MTKGGPGTLFRVLVAALLLAFSGCRQPAVLPSAAPVSEDWIDLFNGRDLEGWTPKFTGHELGINALDTFRVEDGLLTVSYENYVQWDELYGHLFYSERAFSHYWIRAEYRFVGKQVPGAPDWAWRNNGLMLHAQPPETMTLDQEWPVSIEMRLMGAGRQRDHLPTGSLCLIDTTAVVDGKRINTRVTNSTAPPLRGDQWVLAEAEVRGGEIMRFFINGEDVMRHTKTELAAPQQWSESLVLESGYIAIQAESHPTQFRRIEILPLAP